jgi:hypothetical protein
MGIYVLSICDLLFTIAKIRIIWEVRKDKEVKEVKGRMLFEKKLIFHPSSFIFFCIFANQYVLTTF